MQPPMDSHMAMNSQLPPAFKQSPTMQAVNGAMPPVSGAPMSSNPSGPFGDPSQLSNHMASMQINHPGMSNPRHTGPPPLSHPPGAMYGQPGPPGPPGPPGHPSHPLPQGPPIMSTGSSRGPMNLPQMPYSNSGQAPPPTIGNSMHPPHMGPPIPRGRGVSPPYAPPMAGQNYSGNTPAPPPMSNAMGMSGNLMPPSANSMGLPGSPAPPMSSNSMELRGHDMPPQMSNSRFTENAGGPGSSMGMPGGLPPPSTSGSIMPPPGHSMPPSYGGSPMAPPLQPYSQGGPMPPTAHGGTMPPQSSHGGPMPHGSHGLPPPPVSHGGPMPPGSHMSSPGHHMMPPPNPGMPYGSAPGTYSGPGGMPGPYGGPGAPGMAPQPQARRLDPDHMPSVIQVITNDKQQRSGVFSTAQRGVTPPLVTTDFVVQDHGNASPRFIRSTLYNVPANTDLLKQMAVPFVLNITPFAKLHPKENPVPISDMGPQGPVRCNRCKAYMSPFMTFIDGGRRFQCALCGGCTDVPVEYFAHLDHTGRRVDCASRPELWAGSYEIIATKEYCKGNLLPAPPAYIFMLDVSYNSVKSGLTELFCQRLKNDILPNLPRERFPDGSESEPRVGFATYDKDVHFYNLKPHLSQPQMEIVSDLEDTIEVPFIDGFLVSPSEADTLVDSLMELIPLEFTETRRTETILGPAIQAGMEVMKAANCSGKLFVFHTSLPIAEAPGKLKNRDDRKLLGTEKEKQGSGGIVNEIKSILTPSTQYYTKLGEECVAAGCSVDLFIFPNSYIDLATISEVPRLTGGSLYKYTYFQADLHAEQFISDLSRAVSAPVAFDSVMRVRTSAGTRPVDFYGHLYMSNTTDVECAAFDSSKSISVEIKHDDKLTDGELVYIQAAILYTSIGGQRRLRIHNLALSVTTSLQELFRAAELDTLVNFVSKHSLRMALNKTPKDVRESIANQCATILTCYRKNCAQNSNVGQLILPEGMKLLPLYCNCIIKSDALQGANDISTDDRSFLMFLLGSLNVVQSQNFLYPRLIPLHSLDEDSTSLPTSVRASVDRLESDGVYLLENGFNMFLWIGQNVNHEFLQSVFGVQSADQIDVEKSILPDFDNPISERVLQIISQVRAERERHLRLIFIRQQDKLEHWFKHFMVEDRGENGSASYVDFLCHIHKEIRTLMS